MNTAADVEKALQIDTVPSLNSEEIQYNGNIVAYQGDYYIFIDGKLS